MSTQISKSSENYSRDSITGQGKKILLVEDEPQWQLIISQTLKTLDKSITIRCVRSVKHAKQVLYNNSNFDLIISDLLLDGDDDGFSLWTECQKSLRRVPFLMISGMKNPDFTGLVGTAEAPTLIAKPFDVKEMQRIVSLRLNLASKSSKQEPTFVGTLSKKIGLGLFLVSTLLLTSKIGHRGVTSEKAMFHPVEISKENTMERGRSIVNLKTKYFQTQEQRKIDLMFRRVLVNADKTIAYAKVQSNKKPIKFRSYVVPDGRSLLNYQ
jgi:DNA-binding response OmpR family regulator